MDQWRKQFDEFYYSGLIFVTLMIVIGSVYVSSCEKASRYKRLPPVGEAIKVPK